MFCAKDYDGDLYTRERGATAKRDRFDRGWFGGEDISAGNSERHRKNRFCLYFTESQALQHHRGLSRHCRNNVTYNRVLFQRIRQTWRENRINFQSIFEVIKSFFSVIKFARILYFSKRLSANIVASIPVENRMDILSDFITLYWKLRSNILRSLLPLVFLTVQQNNTINLLCLWMFETN